MIRYMFIHGFSQHFKSYTCLLSIYDKNKTQRL